MPTPTHEIDDDDHACSDTPSVWPLLLATGSVLLGYGNQTQAAKRLGMSRFALIRMMAKHDIKRR